MEIHRINKELENVKDISDIDKLISRVNSNKEKISEVINRIDMIKEGTIINVVYDLSKEKSKDLKDLVEIMKKEKNNTRYLKEFYPNFEGKLDYTDNIKRTNNDTNKLLSEIENKKNNFESKENSIEDNEEKIRKFNEKRLYFENKLLKFQISLSNYQNRVKNIIPEEKIEKKFYIGNIEVKNNEQIKNLAINYYNNNQTDLTVEEIYNRLRSSMKVVTKKTIVPSDNLKMDLLKEKSNLKLTDNEIASTLKELREFKTEFNEEFNDYLDASEYYEYFSKIETIENKLVSEQNKVATLDSKLDKTILENDKKLREIDAMNKEQQMKDKMNEQQNQVRRQQPNNPTQQNTNAMQNMSIEELNMRYNMMFGNGYEEEQEINRSRGAR